MNTIKEAMFNSINDIIDTSVPSIMSKKEMRIFLEKKVKELLYE